jgi:death-on-curing protein
MAVKRRPEPLWLSRVVVDAVHHDQLREHGGLPGIRDENVLESALARPQHKWHYDKEKADIPSLAAAYAFGIVKNHPYRDGNKRIGFLVLATFLGINGYDLDVADAEVVDEMRALASGDAREVELAEWIRSHSRRL